MQPTKITETAKEKLYKQVAAGMEADYSSGIKVKVDPLCAKYWGPERTIDAKTIHDLATGLDSAHQVQSQGVIITGARITGKLDFAFSKVLVPLILHGCFIEAVDFKFAMAFFIDLMDSHVMGGITAVGLRVAGPIYLNSAQINNTVDLTDASIDGSLVAIDTSFTAHTGIALHMDRAIIRGNVSLTRFCSRGIVQLLGTHVGGDLTCSAGKITTLENKFALHADAIHVVGSVYLDDQFSANNQVRMAGAHVGGDFVCNSGHFKSQGEICLDIERSRIIRSLYLRNIDATGGVRILGANIGCDVELTKGKIESSGLALNLERSIINNSLILSYAKITGAINLSYANASTIKVDADTLTNSNFQLYCLKYENITPLEGDDKFVTTTDAWLQAIIKSNKNQPQPYEQLARVLRLNGQDKAARMVAINKRKNNGSWVSNKILCLTIYYGYKPWLALIWLTLLIGYGSVRIHGVLNIGWLSSIIHSADVAIPFMSFDNSIWSDTILNHNGLSAWFIVQRMIGWFLLIIAAAAPMRLLSKD